MKVPLINRTCITGWIIIFICVPYIHSAFSLTGVVLSSECDSTVSTDMCLAHKILLLYTVAYLTPGVISAWGVFFKWKSWRVLAWIFFSISLVAAIYDFVKHPGGSIAETLRIKFFALQVMRNKGDTITFLWFLYKDFLNLILLLMLAGVLANSYFTQVEPGRGQVLKN
ncbi:MAG: hypothetical protein PHZ02_05025 [Desulfocapsaceae bacterium]|nr:hypothetical protein [Desulfocapsaceae bacterium]